MIVKNTFFFHWNKDEQKIVTDNKLEFLLLFVWFFTIQKLLSVV